MSMTQLTGQHPSWHEAVSCVLPQAFPPNLAFLSTPGLTRDRCLVASAPHVEEQADQPDQPLMMQSSAQLTRLQTRV
jgi:hypothetical protein